MLDLKTPGAVWYSVGLLVFNVGLVGMLGKAALAGIMKLNRMVEQLKVLNVQLVKDKQEDKEKFAAAWSKLIETGNEGDEARLLNALDALARRSALPNGKQPTAQQQDPDIKDVDELIEQADYEAYEFHYFLRKLTEVQGGVYLQGPNKTRARAMEKIENDYGGDHTKLVDVVRGSAIFTTFIQLTLFVEVLLGDEYSELIVLRAKDRFNKPLDSGYRDVLLNYKFEGTSGHVGELQLHLRTIIDIKESAHRTYALMRAVGWEVGWCFIIPCAPLHQNLPPSPDALDAPHTPSRFIPNRSRTTRLRRKPKRRITRATRTTRRTRWGWR